MDKKKKILTLVAVVLVGGLAALSATGGIDNLRSSAIPDTTVSKFIEKDKQLRAEREELSQEFQLISKNIGIKNKNIGDLNRTKNTLTKKINLLKETCEPQKIQTDKLALLQKELSDLLDKEAKFKQENIDLPKQIATNNAKIKANNTTISSLNTKLKGIKSTDSRYKLYKDQITALTAENKTITLENTSLTQKITKNTAELKLLQDTIDAKTKKITKKGLISVKKDQIIAQEAVIAKLDASKCTFYEMDKQNLINTESSLVNLNQELSNLEAKKDEISDKIAKKDEEIAKNQEEKEKEEKKKTDTCNMNNICETSEGENPSTCPSDCNACNNNGTCEYPESGATCPDDCNNPNLQATCGNMIIETWYEWNPIEKMIDKTKPIWTEVCDDGNSNNGDGCAENCLSETCNNDGVCQDFANLWLGGPGDYKGATSIENEESCPSDCKRIDDIDLNPYCGDGKVDQEEDCDDANGNNEDSCRNNCTYPICGDGITDNQKGEQCDEWSSGNVDDNQGCSSSCSIELHIPEEPVTIPE